MIAILSLLYGTSSMHVPPEALQRVDDSIRSGLQSLRDGFFSCLVLSSFVVAVGLVFEGPEILHDIRNAWRDPDLKAKPWMKVLGFVGWILIIAGCLGEGIAESLTSKADGFLQTFNDTLLGDSFGQSFTAYTQAQYAQSSAAVAIQDATIANTRARELEKEAANQRERASRLEDDAEALRKQNMETSSSLEDEKLKRVKLAVSLLPRGVFDQSGLIARFSSMKPRRILFVYPDESEPRNLAEQIAVIFTSLRWPIWGKQVTENGLREGVHVGLGMKMPNLTPGDPIAMALAARRAAEQRAEAQELADSLILALSVAGLDVSKGFSSEAKNQTRSTLIVEVGAKPNRELEEALRELGMPGSTPLPSLGGATAGGNRAGIPKDPPPETDDSHP